MFDSNNVAIIDTGNIGLFIGARIFEFSLNFICVDKDNFKNILFK
jgi:UDP-glucose 6-dehydrogenase